MEKDHIPTCNRKGTAISNLHPMPEPRMHPVGGCQRRHGRRLSQIRPMCQIWQNWMPLVAQSVLVGRAGVLGGFCSWYVVWMGPLWPIGSGAGVV